MAYQPPLSPYFGGVSEESQHELTTAERVAIQSQDYVDEKEWEYLQTIQQLAGVSGSPNFHGPFPLPLREIRRGYLYENGKPLREV